MNGTGDNNGLCVYRGFMGSTYFMSFFGHVSFIYSGQKTKKKRHIC